MEYNENIDYKKEYIKYKNLVKEEKTAIKKSVEKIVKGLQYNDPTYGVSSTLERNNERRSF